MTIVARNLILSSDISTWKFDRPVLFIGKACLREKDREIWENMDALIAPPIGAESKDRYHLLQESRKFQSEIFPEFVKILNTFHGVSFDERYWKIITGYWFRDTVDLLVNRIFSLDRVFTNFLITGVTTYETPINYLAEANYHSAHLKTNDNYWNDQLFNQIIDLLGVEKLQKERLEFTKTPITKSINRLPNKKLGKPTKEYFYGICRKISQLFVGENSAFIKNSYLPLEKEFLLNIALGQFPQWWISQIINIDAEVQTDTRAELNLILRNSTESKIGKIIGQLLFDLIPTSYLEGFNDLRRETEQSNWPRAPKFIFSSNFTTDDFFKVWTANRVANGTPYFSGQHGNNYGVSKYFQHSIEEETSDKFLTWGWTRGLPQHIPAFIFKNISNGKVKKPSASGLILIEDLLVVRIYVWDQSNQFAKYMDDQFKFVSSLDESIRNLLTVRLHPAHNEHQGDESLLWAKYNKEIRIDNGTLPIRKLWNKNKIIVHSYDSTGLLETLEADIPTIAFWQENLEHLVDEAIPYYSLLVSAGIVHLTPESAASKINEVWDDVEKWWRSREVQEAREVFCSQYARTSKKPIRELKKIILENI